MEDRWMIRGSECSHGNCAWGHSRWFKAPSTHGHCRAMTGGLDHEGFFSTTRLEGLHWVSLLQWSGEIASAAVG
jgi:hypothetical protein